MRHPLRARPGDTRFRAPVPGDQETYDNAGIDIHYETRVTGFSPGKKTVAVAGEGEVGYDKLIVATGFDYADPGVPGTDLGNLYYVKNIRRAIEWDKVLDGVKSAVVVEASRWAWRWSPRCATAASRRTWWTRAPGRCPWPPTRTSSPRCRTPGGKRAPPALQHHADRLRRAGHGARGADLRRDIPCDLAVVCTKKEANTALAAAAGIRIGSASGIIVDERMH